MNCLIFTHQWTEFLKGVRMAMMPTYLDKVIGL